MFRRILLSGMVLAIVLVTLPMSAFAQKGIDYHAHILRDGATWVLVPCPPHKGHQVQAGDRWGFINGEQVPVMVVIRSRDGTIHCYNVAPGDTVYHVIGAKQVSEAEIKMFLGECPLDEADSVIYEACHTQTPTTTQWGIMILIVLMIGSGIFIISKKRKAALSV